MTTTFQQDGTLATGSVDITVLELATDAFAGLFTANNFSWSQDSSEVSKNHADGSPKGREFKPGFTNGSVDLQLADEDQAVPEINHTFVIDGEGYCFTNRALAKEQNGEWKSAPSIAKLVNPLITEPVAAVAYTDAVAITAIASAVVGPEAGLTYAWTASGLPSGLAIDAGTGEITGTPDTVSAGTFKIFASATNAAGNAIKGVRHIPYAVTA